MVKRIATTQMTKRFTKEGRTDDGDNEKRETGVRAGGKNTVGSYAVWVLIGAGRRKGVEISSPERKFGVKKKGGDLDFREGNSPYEHVERRRDKPLKRFVVWSKKTMARKTNCRRYESTRWIIPMGERHLDADFGRRGKRITKGMRH